MFCFKYEDGSFLQSIDEHLYFINPAALDSMPVAGLFIPVSQTQFV